MSADLLAPETVRRLLRECVTVVKPGEVLFFTCPEHFTPARVREVQDGISSWLAHHAPDVRVLVLPHGEMAAAGPETDEAFARRLERVLPGVLAREMRRKAANVP